MTVRTSATSRAGTAMRRMHLGIAGMSCGSCLDRVRSKLERVPGVRVLDLRLGGAVIELQPGVDSGDVTAAVAAAGYRVTGHRALAGWESSSISADDGRPQGCCCGSHATHGTVLRRAKAP